MQMHTVLHCSLLCPPFVPSLLWSSREGLTQTKSAVALNTVPPRESSISNSPARVTLIYVEPVAAEMLPLDYLMTGLEDEGFHPHRDSQS